ncbi:hypothetical protein VTK56DRAFT_9680 [Thermocarpiscus australiensis]
MPKRKRDNDDESVESIFFHLRNELYHALKVAKGFERQRQSKRLRDTKSTPDKKARIEKEVVVLKSLDLHQAAHAHLCSSLLRIKSVAESDKLPEQIKAGVPKPELTEEEKAALHNVTSALYNRKQVKAVIEKAVEAVCGAIGVPVPEKKGRSKGAGRGETEDKAHSEEEEDSAGEEENRRRRKGEKSAAGKEEKAKKSDRVKDGIQDGGEVGRKAHAVKGKGQKGEEGSTDQGEHEESVDEEEEEKAVSQLEDLLGLGSEDEGGDEEEEEVLVKGRTRRADSAGMELDPMEITTDEEGSDDEESDDSDLDSTEVTSDEGKGDSGDEEEFHGFSDLNQGSQNDSASESESEDEDVSDSESSGSSVSRSPPAKKMATSKKAANAPKSRPTDSTFLPTLMGGYISGSESASDIDVAPPRKNRRGQRARQKIWEKKYKEKARHLQKQAAKGRDAGWDPKRGAVDGDSAKPWKRGIRNPLLDKDKSRDSGAGETKQQAPPPKKEPSQRKRDDSGPLHPSWEAKRQAKAKEQLTAPFQGKKITFD